MVTIGLSNNHYDMIIELIDSHMENMINGPMDEHVVGAINEWIDLLNATNDDDLISLAKEYESALDDWINEERGEPHEAMEEHAW